MLAHLGGIQRNIASNGSNYFLVKLEKPLHRELDDVLAYEEMMWHQKSRAIWLNDGDQNTRYYHVKALNRRRRNKIIMLRDSGGVGLMRNSTCKR